MPCNSQLSGAEECQCDQERMSSSVVFFLNHLQACYATASLAELGDCLGSVHSMLQCHSNEQFPMERYPSD